MQNITWSLYGMPAPKGFTSSFDKIDEDMKAEKEETEGFCEECHKTPMNNADEGICEECKMAKADLDCEDEENYPPDQY